MHSSSDTTSPPLREPAGDLKSPGFIGLVLAHVLGTFNDNVLRWLTVPIAQPLLSEKPEEGIIIAVALGGLCLTSPFLLFMPIAGWLADRFNKRTVIVACKIAELVLMVLSILAILYGHLWMLFVLVFFLGTQAALFGPAKFGCIPEILPTRLLPKANGILGLGSIVAVGLGSITGFFLFDHSHPVLGSGDLSSMWLIALVLVGTAIGGLVGSLRIQGSHAVTNPNLKFAWNPISDIIPALRLIRQDVWLLRTAGGIAFFFFVASIAHQNITPYVESVLKLGKSDAGIVLGILIAGVGAGSLLAGIWSDGKVELGIVPYGAFGVVVSSVLVFVAGCTLVPDLPVKPQFAFWGSCLGLFLLGASSGLYSVPLEAYLQYRSDPKQRGMILAGSFFISYVMIVCSIGVFYLLSAPLQLSPSLVFLIGGLMTLPVLVYSFRLLPDWTLRFSMWLIIKTFYRFKVYGRHHIPEKGAALIVCNHLSFLDGVLMCISTSRFMRFIIYADFTELPVLRWMGRKMNVIPIRSNDKPSQIVKSIQIARDALKNGEVVCIFAEGGLSRTGQLQPFQRGLAKIVQGQDIPIVPAYLNGLWGSIFSWRGGRVFWKWPQQWIRSVELHFSEPISPPKDVALVRQAVERLGSEAVTMVATSRDLVPVRRFIRRCKKSRSEMKVVDSTNTKLTGGKLLIAALAFRRALRREVLSASEKQVGVLLPPSAGGCLANMALALDRRVSVNLNYTLSEETIQHCVDKAKIKHILTSRKFLEKKPYTITGAEFVFLEDLKGKVTSFDKAIGAFGALLTPAAILDRQLGLQRISPNETLTIIFTSGSTGEPKGVVLSHANVGSNIDAIDQLLNLKKEDGMLGVLPFFHSFGYTACLWLPMCYSLRGIYHFNPLDAKIVGQLCKEHLVTIMMATPTFLKMYLRRCEKDQFKSVDLIVVGAEKLPVELANEFNGKFGILPTEGYGTTELSPVAAVNVPDHRSHNVSQTGTKLGTVGRPLPGVTAKVVDPETFEDRGLETEGLLLIKGPNVMRGYLDEPEKTNEVIRDGWYNTGDFAILDKQGFVTITGRQSRFSKIGGEMVPHIRIEQELLRICEPPEQEEATITLVVTAVPDENRGERLIVLYTKLCKPVDQVIHELAATGIPKLWLPSGDSFMQVDTIPILGTGKLDLRAVKELALQVCSPVNS
ncbi:MAG TPA: acyl-[ACP]--phospholipid O-acyltransferase [Planctomicrobium sp.]|nr:acyl-[ACP]--phospholipid O-acyltransferase [Planctomicrobium sp.]